MSDMLTFEIDLNMLREDEVQSHVEFMTGAVGRMRPPEAGEPVWAVDEDGARYLAVLEQLHESGFVDLRLKLETARRVDAQLAPAAEVLPTTMLEPASKMYTTSAPAKTALTLAS